MNCPYCTKHIHGMTGFQEAENFQGHLNKCKRRPRNITVEVEKGQVKFIGERDYFTINDALEIRAASGQ